MKYNFCFQCGTKYDENQQPGKFSCSSCNSVFYLNSKPTVSTLIIQDGKVLLGKRKIDPSKGKWDIIGGFLDYGEHPNDGAKREAKEETGLDVEPDQTLGFFMDTYGPGGDKTMNICMTAKVTSGTPIAGDDIEELEWFSADNLPEDIAFQNGKEMLEAWKKNVEKPL